MLPLPPRGAQGSFAENQKIQNIRGAFHKAVATPINNIEHLWKEYSTFENVSTSSEFAMIQLHRMHLWGSPGLQDV